SLVLDDAVDEREQREVASHADVLAGVDARADLPHEDVAGADLFAGVDLHTAALSLTVATVAAAALSLFMSHRATAIRRSRAREAPSSAAGDRACGARSSAASS